MSPTDFAALVRRVDPMGKQYLRRDVTGDGLPETFCNFFAHDVCEAYGAELPQDLVNVQVKWLDEADGGLAAGWSPVDAVEAHFCAERGILTLATWVNEHGHGHIAVLVPSGTDQIHIAQAGRTNFIDGKLAQGFDSLPVRFFTRG